MCYGLVCPFVVLMLLKLWTLLYYLPLFYISLEEVELVFIDVAILLSSPTNSQLTASCAVKLCVPQQVIRGFPTCKDLW